MEPQILTGKVALITGGARRIGAEISRMLHAQGMNLVVHYRASKSEAHALQAELLAIRPDSVILVQGDLLNGAKLENLVSRTMENYRRLDVLVNNASSFYPTPVGEATDRHWDDLVGSNLRAPFFLSQAAMPHLKKSAGCIVNITDIHAERPLKNYSIYSIAKAGLVMLTKSLAREFGPEVRVNAVAPGTILWPENELDEITKQRILSRVPQRRSGEPADIARAVLFLVRDAGYVSGQVIAVDGGRSVVA
ncbi:MAG: pteridine reductase [Acidiferrobacterales bacterium]